MRLENIKLSGFKSFVDPTLLTLPSNLTAIVGPNGCGKSNIIDAIRWVMGESSAKQLRGQSLDDVIFNGCTTRKPLGQASVELNFDNSDGNLGGHYSSYTQLSIRREITREGHSTYYLNGTRCRRRDIRHIFLGTGLGPRSYAIIEQGMIARIVEAKPEELRAYIEEAAGVSKYKEGRRETENRLMHTHENLNRLKDLREELSKQCKHLQRQAHTAERYKTLKQEERLLKARLQALLYRNLNEQLEAQLICIKEAEIQINNSEQDQERVLRAIAEDREHQNQIRKNSDSIQSDYYELGKEIIRLEDKLHGKNVEFQKNQQEEITLTQKIQVLIEEEQANQIKQAQLTKEMATLNKSEGETKSITEQSQIALKKSDQDLKNWQDEWEKTQVSLAQLTQQGRTEETQIQYCQQQKAHLTKQLARLVQEQTEQAQIFDIQRNDKDIEEALVNAEQKLHMMQLEQEQMAQQINEQRTILHQLDKALATDKGLLQTNQGQTASLLALQQDALGHGEKTLVQWLKQHNLIQQPRLAQLLCVETGWEHAIEVALNQHIQAICFTDRDSLDDFLHQSLPTTPISLMVKSPPFLQETYFDSQLPLKKLSTKLSAPWPLDNLLVGIYTADTLEEAIPYTKQLKAHEWIITPQGICLGNHWIRLHIPNDVKSGLLQRERKLIILKKQQETIQTQINKKQAIHIDAKKNLETLEKNQIAQQKQLAEFIAYQADLKTRYQIKELRLLHAKQRYQQMDQELNEHRQQINDLETQLEKIQKTQKITQDQYSHSKQQQQTLLQTKTTVQTQFNEAMQKTRTCEAQLHQFELRCQTIRYQLTMAQEAVSRLELQKNEIENRIAYLKQALKEAENPINILKEQLNSKNDQYQKLDHEFKKNQTSIQTIDQQLKQKEEKMQAIAVHLTHQRDALQNQHLQCQTLKVRANTLEEQLYEQSFKLKDLLKELPNDSTVQAYEAELKQIQQDIEQLGAVNLAALEEHQSTLERKTYLDNQCQDLLEALETLQTAIQKMDKETRNRFKETFDKANDNFKALFPRLFSGGEASLELQESDLLSSGVYIMAQPPGKRTSSIHLLSGGEKALTATALVFSFFQLNPAPFCMLDEVDAPLDDANVLRFCKLVRDMAKEVQFIFISHNKVTIAMAQHLAGVTMHEPGVSRLVAVDVEKAMAMASA